MPKHYKDPKMNINVLDFKNNAEHSTRLAKFVTEQANKSNYQLDAHNLVDDIELSHTIVIRQCRYTSKFHFEVIGAEQLGKEEKDQVYPVLGEVIITNNRASFQARKNRVVKLGAEAEYQTTSPYSHMKFMETTENTYLFMKYFVGKQLEDYTESNNILTIDEKLRLSINLAEALYYQVHSHDIMHLDTQKKNIICDTNRRLSFIDYGMSERVDAILYANRTDFSDGVNDFQALAANLYEIWTGNFASQIWPIGDDNEGEDILLEPINGLDDTDHRSLADLISGLQHGQITSIAAVISILETIRINRLSQNIPTEQHRQLQHAYQCAIAIKTPLFSVENNRLLRVFIEQFNEKIRFLEDTPFSVEQFTTTLNFSTFFNIYSKSQLVEKAKTLVTQFNNNRLMVLSFYEVLSQLNVIAPNNPLVVDINKGINTLYFSRSDKGVDSIEALNKKIKRKLDDINTMYDQFIVSFITADINQSLFANNRNLIINPLLEELRTLRTFGLVLSPQEIKLLLQASLSLLNKHDGEKEMEFLAPEHYQTNMVASILESCRASIQACVLEQLKEKAPPARLKQLEEFYASKEPSSLSRNEKNYLQETNPAQFNSSSPYFFNNKVGSKRKAEEYENEYSKIVCIG